MALLLGTKINEDGSWTLTPSDARELAQSLLYAANQSQEHESICPVLVGGFDCGHKHFYMNVNPHQPKDYPIYMSPTSKTEVVLPRRPLWKRILGM